MSRVWKGQASLERRLKAIRSPKALKLLGAALFDIGEDAASDMKGSIMRGSVSGKGHVPSKPGEPPSNDTQRLHDLIEVTGPVDLVVEVASNAGYSTALEFGTSKMGARPFARPARDKNRRPGRKKIADAVDRIVKGAAD